MLPWARCREPLFWVPWARWPAPSLDTRQGLRSRVPGGSGDPHRDPGRDAKHKPCLEPRSLELSNKPPTRWFRRRLLEIPTRLPENVRRRFRDLNKETFLLLKQIDKIDIRLWSFRLFAEGERAVAAVKWPLTIILVAFGLAILITAF